MTVTPRLFLNQPAITDHPDVVNVLRHQIQKIDDSFDSLVGLSSGRPGAPFDGQLFFETDNVRLVRYDAASVQWVEYTNGKGPLGRLAFISATTASTAVNGNQEVGPYFTITFNAKKNRRYAFHWILTNDHQSGSNTGSKWIVVRQSNAPSPVTQASNQVSRTIADVADNSSGLSVRQIGGGFFIPDADAAITLGVFLQSTSGLNPVLINGSSYHTFSVEDVGAA
jgi:hypothetical protein